MVDLYGMDPARIERLRSPERLEYFDPAKIWDALDPDPSVTLVDIGSGVGFVTLPFARRYPQATAVGCDILEGMVALLKDAASEEGLGNVDVRHMEPGVVPLDADSADIVVMAQVHHELDAPAPLLADCARILRPGGTIAIVDWKDEDNGKSPAAGRRVPPDRIRAELTDAGFRDIQSHEIYTFHTFLSATLPA